MTAITFSRISHIRLVPTSFRTLVRYGSFSVESSRVSLDPTAKRPTKKCDPYDQGGKPLEGKECDRLLSTLDPQWKLVCEEGSENPNILRRSFVHENFMIGATFIQKIAAVAFVNNHYPSLSLVRKLDHKSWKVMSRVDCRTEVLGGLSYNDFQIAMYIDLEADRHKNLHDG